MKFWKKVIFWDRFRNTLALLGAPGGAVAGYVQTDPVWLTVGAVCGFVAAAIAIWMVDKNNNGVVDIFE